jgi:biopolymer transport protein ExbD
LVRTRFSILVLVALCAACALLVACDAGPTVSSNLSADALKVDPIHNLIVINDRNEVLWNGAPITLEQLKANLEHSRSLPVEPELQFKPDSHASYDVSVEVLNVIRDSNVTKLGFVGNEKYVTPGRD